MQRKGYVKGVKDKRETSNEWISDWIAAENGKDGIDTDREGRYSRVPT
jgi:hypothetical protein